MQDNSHQVSLQGDNIKKYHKNLKEWMKIIKVRYI